MQPLTVAERRAILDEQVRRYAARGYRLHVRTDVTALMKKPGWVRSRSSMNLACALTVLTIGFWIVVELVVYALGVYREKSVHLEVDPHGEVSVETRQIRQGSRGRGSR